MKKLRRLTGLPGISAALFLLATLLLIGGSIGSTRAALSARSDYYSAGVDLASIRVDLLEKSEEDSAYHSVKGGGVLLANLTGEGEKLQPGREYSEQLAVQNTGSMDAFVRVSVYRYWVDSDGEKRLELDPELIHLSYVDGWMLDGSAPSRNGERSVYYYGSSLAPGQTVQLTDTLSIDNEIVYHVTQTREGNTVTNTYAYDGKDFQIRVEVDAVQARSGEAAVQSAWGRSVTVSDNSLILN